MNIGELKKAIENMPDDVDITMGADPEGNAVWFLGGVDKDVVYHEGDIISIAWDPDYSDFEDEAEHRDFVKDKRPVIYLWPTYPK